MHMVQAPVCFLPVCHLKALVNSLGPIEHWEILELFVTHLAQGQLHPSTKGAVVEKAFILRVPDWAQIPGLLLRSQHP